jgi:hypothetical protein
VKIPHGEPDEPAAQTRLDAMVEETTEAINRTVDEIPCDSAFTDAAGAALAASDEADTRGQA